MAKLLKNFSTAKPVLNGNVNLNESWPKAEEQWLRLYRKYINRKLPCKADGCPNRMYFKPDFTVFEALEKNISSPFN